MLQGTIALPPGRTLDDVRGMKPDEGEWREVPGVFCAKDNDHAFLHPHTDFIMGCKTCGETEDISDGHIPRLFRRAPVGSDID